MSTEDLPQIYLVTPSVIDLDHYPAQLARVLDTVEVACLRLRSRNQNGPAGLKLRNWPNILNKDLIQQDFSFQKPKRPA